MQALTQGEGALGSLAKFATSFDAVESVVEVRNLVQLDDSIPKWSLAPAPDEQPCNSYAALPLA